MEDLSRVSCVMCLRREETETTGALSTKDEVTAHQNCLLFSSGLFCRHTPQFDDLFGFSVEDVLKEVKRGSKLACHKCKKKGATAGCEVKRCKRSFHYPCAIQDGAKVVENADQGKYGLYCFKHDQQTQRHDGSVNGRPSSVTKSRSSRSSSEAGSSKMSTRARRLSVCSSDSNSSSSGTPSSSKRKMNFRDKQEGVTPSKRKAWNIISTDDSSNSDINESDSEMAIFAPVETDLDTSANSVPEAQLIRKDNESPTGSTSGNPVGDGSIHGNDDDDDETILPSDAESESLLLPESRSPSATSAVVSTQTALTLFPCVVVLKTELDKALRRDQGSSPDQSPDQSPAQSPAERSTGPPPSPNRFKLLHPTRSPPCTSSAISPAPPVRMSLRSSPSLPLAPPSDPEPRFDSTSFDSTSFDSTSFWKSCNAAGCTQALFTGFINEMNDISSRIQSDLASREDYDRALTVMTASGKLAELVAKQQEELQRKQAELLKATAAMKEVVSALKTRVRQQTL